MEVKREPLEMSAFVSGLIGAARQMAEAKGLTLENASSQPGLGAVMLDRDKLEKIILNLVFNALKFTPAGGVVTLRVEGRGTTVITVKDTGVGIAEKNLPFVFDRFWQADDSSKRKYQGVGIGLSLVKELTEIQGGKVSRESQEGQRHHLHPAPALCVQGGNRRQTGGGAAHRRTGIRRNRPPRPPAQSEEWLANLYRRAELFPPPLSRLSGLTAAAPAAIGAQWNQWHPPTCWSPMTNRTCCGFSNPNCSTHYHVIEAVDGQQAVEKAGQAFAGHHPAGHEHAGEGRLAGLPRIARTRPRRRKSPSSSSPRARMRKPSWPRSRRARMIFCPSPFRPPNFTSASKIWWNHTITRTSSRGQKPGARNHHRAAQGNRNRCWCRPRRWSHSAA